MLQPMTTLTETAGSTALRGIACFMISIALFAGMDVMIKTVAGSYPTLQIVFFRSLFALLPLSVAVARSGGLAGLRTRRPMGHVVRSAVGVGAMICFFHAFASMPLADVYAIVFAGPLFLTALAVPMLGERVGWRRWSAVAVGFVGVLVILRPGTGMLSGAALVCLLGSFLYALAMIMIRLLGRTEGTVAIVVYFTLTCVAVGGIGMIPDWVTPTGPDLATLVAIGVTGGIAQLFITSAFRMAPAGTLAPFEYTALVWGLAFGWLFFGDWPDGLVFVGAGIVAASGLYIVHREAARHRAPRAPSVEHPY
jgi:drug/metabolite transporter (DMT)-like permease